MSILQAVSSRFDVIYVATGIEPSLSYQKARPVLTSAASAFALTFNNATGMPVLLSILHLH